MPKPAPLAGLRARTIAGLLCVAHAFSFPRCLYLVLPCCVLGLGILCYGWWLALPAHLPGDESFNTDRALVATLRSLTGTDPAPELLATPHAVDMGLLIAGIALLLLLTGVILRVCAAGVHRGAMRLAAALRLVLVDSPESAPPPPVDGELTTLLLYPAPVFGRAPLSADADSARALRALTAHAAHLREVHALSTDTQRNLALAENLLAARGRAGCAHKLERLSIRIDSRALRSSIGRDESLKFADTVADAQLLSMPEMRSRHLLRAQPPNKMRIVGIGGRPVLVIIGLGDSGLELLVRLCAHAQSPHLDPLTLVLVDTDASAKVREVLELWPALNIVVSLIPIPFEPHLPQSAAMLMVRLEREGLLATNVYVALEDEALAGAWEQEIELAVRSTARVPPLVMRLNSLSESDALLLHDEETIARLQQEVHHSYLGGAKRHTNVNWSQLSFDYREDNRSEVDHYWTKANDLGWAIAPGGGQADFAASAEQLDSMAAAEHRRWIASRAVAGWRFGVEHSDDARTHPSLVGWNELSDDERQKDRAMVQRMSQTLQAANFGLRALRTAGLPRGLDPEACERLLANAPGAAPGMLAHWVMVVEDARSFEQASRLSAEKDLALSLVISQPLMGLAAKAGVDPRQAKRLMEQAQCVWLTTPVLLPQVLSRWPSVSA